MRGFAKRRLVNLTLAIVAGLLIAVSGAVYVTAVNQNGFLTGWILFGLVVVLSGYHVRKKVSTLPIGMASSWLQVHIYGGFIALFAFFVHIGWRIPDGIFEGLFATVFLLVALSGVFGIAVNRIFPKRLARRGEEVIFERILGFMARLREQAEEILLTSSNDTGSTVLREFYLSRLSPFFAGPRSRLGHLLSSNRTLFEIQSEMDNLERYLSTPDRERLSELRYLVERKDELDFDYALQGVIKFWLFIHVPLTVALLIGTLLHMVLVHAFSGGMS
jgi:hypothetical protein